MFCVYATLPLPPPLKGGGGDRKTPLKGGDRVFLVGRVSTRRVYRSGGVDFFIPLRSDEVRANSRLYSSSSAADMDLSLRAMAVEATINAFLML